VHKLPTSLKICATLGKLKWQIVPSTQYSYVYILMNHWIATVIVSIIVKRVLSHNILNLYTICSKCPPLEGTKISDVDELKRRVKNEWSDLNHTVYYTYCWRRGANVHAFVLEADISSIWCKDDMTCYRISWFLLVVLVQLTPDFDQSQFDFVHKFYIS